MNNKIYEIVEFSAKIISEEKIGSCYEGNDVTRLWKLGDKIFNLFKPLDLPLLLPKLQEAHKLRNLRYDDRLYRASIIFRQYWTEEKDYIKAIKKINVWTKLRELYPICKGIVENKSEYTREDIEKLIDKCENLTYMEVRDVFIKFRGKTDKLLNELGIDGCEFNELIIQLSDELNKVIEENDIITESKIRIIFSPKYLRDLRLLLSALQKEDVYQNKKWKQEIKKIVKKNIPTGEPQIIRDINKVFEQIIKFITNDNARKKIREETTATFIGNLSTYLRAIESDANKKQYQKNKEILNKFIGKISL